MPPSQLPALFYFRARSLPTRWSRPKFVKRRPSSAHALFVHALSVSLEGVLFATNDAQSVAKLYIGNALAMGLAFSWARARGPTLSTVWGGFFLYNIVRCAQFSARLAWNQRDRGARRRRKRDVPAGWALAPRLPCPSRRVFDRWHAAREHSMLIMMCNEPFTLLPFSQIHG